MYAPLIRPSTSASDVICCTDSAISGVPTSVSVICVTTPLPPPTLSGSSASRCALTCAALSLIVALAPSVASVAPYASTFATVWSSEVMLLIRSSPTSVPSPLAAASIAAAESVTLSLTPLPRCESIGASAAAVGASSAVPSDSVTVPSTLPSSASVAASAAICAPVSDTSIVAPPRYAPTGSSPAATSADTVTGVESLRLMCSLLPNAERAEA